MIFCHTIQIDYKPVHWQYRAFNPRYLAAERKPGFFARVKGGKKDAPSISSRGFGWAQANIQQTLSIIRCFECSGKAFEKAAR